MTTEIILCDNCKGSGLINHEQLVDYHKCEYSYWTTQCKACKGSGRLVKKVNYSITAFVPEKPDK